MLDLHRHNSMGTVEPQPHGGIKDITVARGLRHDILRQARSVCGDRQIVLASEVVTVVGTQGELSRTMRRVLL